MSFVGRRPSPAIDRRVADAGGTSHRLRADALYAIPERGDRLVAATAAHLDLPLVTRDPAIARAAAVPVVL